MVEGYGKAVIDLVQRGYLPSLLEKLDAIARAVEVGREWLGDSHPAVECLKTGVAIHHGRLPNPFLREVEVLLSEGIVKVTVASPTLAQGLNLNAAVLLVPSIYRAGKLLSGEEFANVAGRAGRAFVDVEGLVVHVMHEGEEWRQWKWRELVASAKARTLRSGLIQIVAEILARLAQEGVLTRDDALEYLANSRDAWKSADEESNEDSDQTEGDDEEEKQEPLSHLIEKLDATVFGLVEALDAESSDLPRLLDEALRGSLWERQLSRETENMRNAHKAILEARARLIWNNSTPRARKGHFAMGVGLEAGLALDSMADELGSFLDSADDAALTGEQKALGDALVELARRLLVIRPFTPEKKNELPSNWERILAAWVTGVSVNAIGADNMRIVEDAFSYRLVWALEALRTRRMTLGWSPDTIPGGGAASLETGVPQLMMSMLIRAGLPSRQAAMIAVRKGEAMFVDGAGMRSWLESANIAKFTKSGAWPTPETAALWKRFRDDVLSGGASRWRVQHSKRTLDLSSGKRPSNGIYRIEIDEPQGNVWVCAPDYQRLVQLNRKVRDVKPSFFTARFVEDDPRAHVERFGRDGIIWQENG
jgi:hypothetical protein